MMNLDPSLAYTALMHWWPDFAAMDMRKADPLIGELAAAMTAANPKDRWAFARTWIAVRAAADPGADDALTMWLLTLPAGTDPATCGPLCDGWWEAADPADAGCGHASCYAVAYREPLHQCAVEADHADPMSQHYAMYLATCRVCELWQEAGQRARDERAWEAHTERTNR